MCSVCVPAHPGAAEVHPRYRCRAPRTGRPGPRPCGSGRRTGIDPAHGERAFRMPSAGRRVRRGTSAGNRPGGSPLGIVVEEGGLGVIAGFARGQVRFGLDAPVAPEVGNRYPALPQDPPDEQVAVAPGGILLAAEQGDPGRPGPGQDLVEALLERRARGETAVEHVALLVVELIALRPAAKFPA